MYRIRNKQEIADRLGCSRELLEEALIIAWEAKIVRSTLDSILNVLVKLDLTTFKELLRLNSLRGSRYLPKFYMLLLDITEEEACAKVEEFKSRKVTSLEGFIQRHGEEKGSEMFKKFQRTSAISSSETWWRTKFGDKWKEERTQAKKNCSPWCQEYWILKGFDDQEAIQKVSEYQLANAGVFEEYYRQKNLSDEEIQEVMKEIRYKKSLTSRNRNHLKDIYGDSWVEVYKGVATKYRKAMEDKGIWINLDEIDSFYKYRTLVNFYTSLSLKQYGLNSLELRSRKFHVDHKYSQKSGFVNDIPAEIIGSIVNLEMIPGPENSSKKSKNSIGLETLLLKYKELKENENHLD